MPGDGGAGATGPAATGPGASVRERLAAARLYLCTDARRGRGDLADFCDAVLAAGVDIVQLRDKGLEAREEIALTEVVADAARRHGRLVVVNDRADLAHALGTTGHADGLHLGQDDLPVAAARAVLGPAPLLGRSTHSPDEVAAAAADPDVDYFCVGPTWPTPTKPGRPAPGPALLAHAARLVDPLAGKPWFAIGGIDATTLPEVVAHGARRVVVVRAVTEADDPATAVRELRAGLGA